MIIDENLVKLDANKNKWKLYKIPATKMAEELGLEYESPEEDIADSDTTASDAATEEFVAKEPLGINVGLASSVGLIKGESFSGGLPVGATVVLTTPLGFKVGPFDYTVSLGVGNYLASSENADGSKGDFNPIVGIRVAVPTSTPIDPGHQHKADYSKEFKSMLKYVEVVNLEKTEDIIPAYKKFLEPNAKPTVFVEYVERYGY